MRIAIIASGSRGDVQPYIALGKGLHEAGHTVWLLTHHNFEALVVACGLEFWPLRGNVQEVAESEEMRALLEKGNFIAISRYTAQAAKGAAVRWAEDGMAACQGMEMLVAGLGGLFLGISLAEKLGLPLLQAYYVPFTPTKAFPGALLPQSTPRLGGRFNRLTHHATREIMWQGSRAADKLAREQVLGLPAASFWGPYDSECLRGMPVLYGYSPSVIPAPPDWGADQHVTGYWFLNEGEGWTPPPALIDFLEAGPAPIYIGFGSMSSRKPEETAELVIAALRLANQRAILLSGWSGLQKADVPDTIFMIDSVPHSWLFPRLAAVVHHGGAGTTAAGLRAGVPSVVIPFFGDPPFWGERFASLGVGPTPVPRGKLTAERLASAIQEAVTNKAMRQRAAALGAKIQAEDGVARAVAVVQQMRVG